MEGNPATTKNWSYHLLFFFTVTQTRLFKLRTYSGFGKTLNCFLNENDGNIISVSIMCKYCFFIKFFPNCMLYILLFLSFKFPLYLKVSLTSVFVCSAFFKRWLIYLSLDTCSFKNNAISYSNADL